MKISIWRKQRIFSALAKEFGLESLSRPELEAELKKQSRSNNWASRIDLNRANEREILEVYGLLHSRRMQWDSLLWQVPLISLTGVSFLFTIIFSPSTSKLSRIEVCLLALVISYATLVTLARHRLSEVFDANLMQGIEKMRSLDASDKALIDALEKTQSEGFSIHGTRFKSARDTFRDSPLGYLRTIEERNGKFELKKRNIWDYLIVKLNKWRAFTIWMFVFILFMLTSVLCLVIGLTNPELFNN